MRNQILAASIDAVMQSPSPAQYLVDLHLISKTNASFSYQPLVIKSLLIQQHFATAYTDSIVISFDIASADYAAMQDNAQDLMGVLTLTYTDQQGHPVFTPPPIQTIYRVTIVNPKNIRRQLSDVAQRVTPDNTITLRLIDQTIYNLRHIQINGIYQKTTLAAAITHIAKTFNFPTLHLVPPDNIHTYDHIVIPPTLGFDEVFDYLQTTYGVYMKGLNFYGRNKILYVYPPYETAPKFPQTCVAYQSDDGAYAGAQSFYKTTGTTTELVINRESQSQDLTIASGENHGTASMFLRSSEIIDGVVTVDPIKGAQYNTNLAASLRLKAPRMAQVNAQNTSYARATDNPFSLASRLAAGQAVLLSAAWAHGAPFLLQPGCAVRYSYDHNGAQVTQTGILEEASFVLEQGPRVGHGIMFLSSGNLVFRLAPDPSVTS